LEFSVFLFPLFVIENKVVAVGNLEYICLSFESRLDFLTMSMSHLLETWLVKLHRNSRSARLDPYPYHHMNCIIFLHPKERNILTFVLIPNKTLIPLAIGLKATR
jgi:nucleoside-triphosphatase THEP1